MNLDNLQKAIFSALSADTDIAAVVSTRIYADVPQVDDSGDDTQFPFITLGEDTAISDDTKTTLGVEATVQLNLWSRSQNFIEVKNLGKLVHTALHHEPLTITDATHTLTIVESVGYTRDPDGHTKQGVILLRIKYDLT